MTEFPRLTCAGLRGARAVAQEELHGKKSLVDRLRTEPPIYGTRALSTTQALREDAADDIERLRRPFRNVDAQDWQYIASIIPDGGRGRFWKTVLAEMRIALGDNR